MAIGHKSLEFRRLVRTEDINEVGAQQPSCHLVPRTVRDHPGREKGEEA